MITNDYYNILYKFVSNKIFLRINMNIWVNILLFKNKNCFFLSIIYYLPIIYHL